VPQGRCYQSAWYAHPFVHVFGGKADKKQLNDLVSFNVLTNTWKKCFSMDSPSVRSQAAVVKATDTEAFLFGGFNETKETLLNDMWLCDLSAIDPHTKNNELTGMVWEKVKAKGKLPSPRKGHSFTRVPNQPRALLYGGLNYNSVDLEAKPDNDIYSFDFKSREWSVVKFLGQYPEPRSQHTFTFFNEHTFVIMGGITTGRSEGLDKPKVFADFHMC